jgi:hypothetical protein
MYKCSVCDKIQKRIPKRVIPFRSGSMFLCRKCQSRFERMYVSYTEEVIEEHFRGVDFTNAEPSGTISGAALYPFHVSDILRDT